MPKQRSNKKLPILIGAIAILGLAAVLFMNDQKATKAAQNIAAAPSENSLAPPVKPGRFMVQPLTPGFHN